MCPLLQAPAGEHRDDAITLRNQNGKVVSNSVSERPCSSSLCCSRFGTCKSLHFVISLPISCNKRPLLIRYNAVMSSDSDAVAKIVQVTCCICQHFEADNTKPLTFPQRLQLTVAAKDVQHKDRRIALQCIMSAWVRTCALNLML